MVEFWLVNNNRYVTRLKQRERNIKGRFSCICPSHNAPSSTLFTKYTVYTILWLSWSSLYHIFKELHGSHHIFILWRDRNRNLSEVMVMQFFSLTTLSQYNLFNKTESYNIAEVNIYGCIHLYIFIYLCVYIYTYVMKT